VRIWRDADALPLPRPQRPVGAPANAVVPRRMLWRWLRHPIFSQQELYATSSSRRRDHDEASPRPGSQRKCVCGRVRRRTFLVERQRCVQQKRQGACWECEAVQCAKEVQEDGSRCSKGGKRQRQCAGAAGVGRWEAPSCLSPSLPPLTAPCPGVFHALQSPIVPPTL